MYPNHTQKLISDITNKMLPDKTRIINESFHDQKGEDERKTDVN